ncbi:LamG domain-containing protein [Streptomyces pratensis]|uniref:LamG domain-containing protein n=1 Tax=Streptomyces pratensis TaxID=1169025 RepID=UPI0019333132|nr:LamG domain-containing protein [Streptomyces pratensis]
MITHSRRRAGTGAAVTGLVAVLLAATPGTAAAAGENLPPLKPSTGALTADLTKACSDQPVYVPRAPELRATVEDTTEDNEEWETNRAGAEFEAWWTDADGLQQRRSHASGTVQSPTTQLWRMPSDLPADTVVSWHARAVDDEGATSAWSDEAPGVTCRFIIDAIGPEPATVVSEQYPDDNSGWHDGVGVYGSFTFDSPSEDVVEYVYSGIGIAPTRVRPDEPGGPATIRWMPEDNGPYYIQVRAVDRAGRSSSQTTYYMRVAAGRAPVAHWTLADPAGSDTAAAEAGQPARAEDGVLFGAPAPSRSDLTSTVTLDGRGNSYLTPDAPAADTTKTFALSAWVRPAATGTPMAAASQDGVDDTSAFTLGLRPSEEGPARWAFRYGTTTLTGGSATAGGWAHLAGLYDTEDSTLRLYVNGKEVASEAGVAPVAAPGAFQIGRARGDSGTRWKGEIGDVRVWDRVVPRKEIEALGPRPADLVAAWDIERTDDGVAPDREGNKPLTLHGGVGFYTPDIAACLEDPECVEFPLDALDGNDHLALDGTDDYAATSAPVADTADSYSVGLRVRFADTTPDRPMTVLSQGDADSDAFKVRYDPAASEWQLVVTHGGETGAEETVVGGAGAPTSHTDEVVVVYDDSEGHITLYVKGEAVATAEFNASWNAPGPLQVGRGHTADGGWGEYFHGGADTVRFFDGALTAAQVKSFAYLY